jgi:hypothetical protein
LWRKYDAAVLARPNENDNDNSNSSSSSNSSSKYRREGLSPDVLEVSYADLTSDPVSTLRAVYAHVSVPLSPAQTALLERETEELRKSYKKNRLGDLSAEMRVMIRGRFKGYFEAFKYK